jgi:16S rRNA processing protein RimM
MPENAANLVLLGRLTEPWGIKGFLRLHPFGDDPLSWQSIASWHLSRDDKAPPREWQIFRLEHLKPQGSGWVLKLESVTERTAAEALAGMYCAVPQQDLPPTAENEFYWGDLVGMTVVNREGRPLGEVHHLISTGAHDVLCVRALLSSAFSETNPASPPLEYLIPFVPAYVGEIDRKTRRIEVDWHEDWS